MGLKLQGLEELLEAESNQGGASTGAPLMIPLDEIEPDPDQPRKKLRPGHIEDLAKSIKKKGVKSPISVRPKGANGKYRINHGECRWRASQLAGKPAIPAFVDAEHDSYDQMIENIQREDLTPLEIGNWILARMKTGDKQVDIAETLGKDKSWVSRHVKIAQAGTEIHAAAEKCADYTALAELVTAFEQFPDQTASFIERQEQIARKDVLALVDRCRAPAESFPEVDEGQRQGQQLAQDAPQAGGATAAGEQSAKSIPPTEKNGPPKSSEKPAGAASGQQPKVAPKQSADPLSLLYSAQVVGKKSADAVVQDLDDDVMLKVFRTLAKAHKRGRSIGCDGMPAALAQGLTSGEFSAAGEGIYMMLAFLDGATSDAEFTTERMKERCLKPVDSLA